MKALIEVYDRSLAGFFRPAGYARPARGTYVRSDDGIIWRGLWVMFHVKGRTVVAQPNLAVFCPSASRVVEEGLGQVSGNAVGIWSSKLGAPFMIQPLYDRVRSQCREDRTPYSYSIDADDQIDGAAQLIYEDFSNVANGFFGHIASIRHLRDHIVAHPFGSVAGVNAMALSYLLDPRITRQKIDELARITPNTMTGKFATRLKNKIGIQG